MNSEANFLQLIGQSMYPREGGHTKQEVAQADGGGFIGSISLHFLIHLHFINDLKI